MTRRWRSGPPRLLPLLVVMLVTLTPWRAAAQGNVSVIGGGFVELTALTRVLVGAITNELGNTPTPTGGGFTYEFDPALGVFNRTSESFGPIFADRAETTGRGRITLTGSYTRLTPDEIDGVPLRTGDLKGLLILQGPGGTAFNLLSIREEAKADIFAISGLYGVTDRLDVGITIPIVHGSFKASFKREGFVVCPPGVNDPASPVCPAFRTGEQTLPSTGDNTGVGDIVLRGKYNFLRLPNVVGGRLGLAASLDLKLPTGENDQDKFRDPLQSFDPSKDISETRFTVGDPPLGTGILRVKPQLIASGSWFGISPRVNVGFELGTTKGITNDLVYAVGLDYTLLGRVTLVADLLGRHALSDDRPTITREGPRGTANPDMLTASLGFKANPIGTLLVFVNFLLPINQTGLRDDVTPTFGVEWSF